MRRWWWRQFRCPKQRHEWAWPHSSNTINRTIPERICRWCDKTRLVAVPEVDDLAELEVWYYKVRGSWGFPVGYDRTYQPLP